MKRMDVRVADSVFPPRRSGQKIHVRKHDDKVLYKVWLYLEGNDLPFVQYVTYHLHPTFANPDRTVRRTAANPDCQLIIWTWGLFNVRAKIVDKNGNFVSLDHMLQYDQQIRRAEPEDFEWEK